MARRRPATPKAGVTRRSTAQVQALATELARRRPDLDRDWAKWIEDQIQTGRAPLVPDRADPRIIEYYFQLSILMRRGRPSGGTLGILAVLGFDDLIKETALRTDLRALAISFGLPVDSSTYVVSDAERQRRTEREATRVIKRSSEKPEVRERFNSIRNAARATKAIDELPNATLHNLVQGAIEFSTGGDLYGVEDLSDIMPALMGTEPLTEHEIREIKRLTAERIESVIERCPIASIIDRTSKELPFIVIRRKELHNRPPHPEAIKEAIVAAIFRLAMPSKLPP